MSPAYNMGVGYPGLGTVSSHLIKSTCLSNKFIQSLHTTCWVAQYSYYVCGHLGINLINKTTIPLGKYQYLVSNGVFWRALSIYASPIKFSEQSGNISFDNHIVYPRLIYTSFAKFVSLQLFGYFVSLVYMNAYQFQEWNELVDMDVVDVTLGNRLRRPYTSYDVHYGIP